MHRFLQWTGTGFSASWTQSSSAKSNVATYKPKQLVCAAVHADLNLASSQSPKTGFRVTLLVQLMRVESLDIFMVKMLNKSTSSINKIFACWVIFHAFLSSVFVVVVVVFCCCFFSKSRFLCQLVWIQIRTDVPDMGLSCQQTAKVKAIIKRIFSTLCHLTYIMRAQQCEIVCCMKIKK